jgi:Protein tyrosine and serine/threonine kinase
VCFLLTRCSLSFGLSQTIPKGDHSVPVSDQAVIPWRWCDPRVLVDREFCKSTDVFAYGCTLWEICRRKHPFHEVIDPRDVIRSVARGERLPRLFTSNVNVRADQATLDFLYGIMWSCWVPPGERVKFRGLAKEISKYIDDVGDGGGSHVPGTTPERAGSDGVQEYAYQIGGSERAASHVDYGRVEDYVSEYGALEELVDNVPIPKREEREDPSADSAEYGGLEAIGAGSADSDSEYGSLGALLPSDVHSSSSASEYGALDALVEDVLSASDGSAASESSYEEYGGLAPPSGTESSSEQ